jgi:aspartyl-tRNA(Asn)/glutamyl-tRNA(Gln) amidotransferase subunit A
MWPGVRDDLTRYTRSSLDQTADLTPPKLARTIKGRLQLQADAAALFEEVDVLLTPTTAVPAFGAEGPPTEVIDGEPTSPPGAGATPFTMLANLCWNPAISVPAGTTSEGLPVGLQVVARRHQDEVPLRLGRIWEQARPWPRHAPADAWQ